MAAGSIKLQSNDLRVATVTFEDGAAGNVSVVVPKEGGKLTSINTAIVKDSDTGAAYLPAGTTAQRPVSPANGYMRYNTTLLAMEAYVNGAWGSVGGGATGGGTDKIFNLNGQTINTDYTIPVGQNAVTAGDITIESGVTVTISSGSKWSIV